MLQCHILDNDILDSSMKTLKNKVKDLIPDLHVWRNSERVHPSGLGIAIKWDSMWHLWMWLNSFSYSVKLRQANTAFLNTSFFLFFFFPNIYLILKSKRITTLSLAIKFCKIFKRSKHDKDKPFWFKHFVYNFTAFSMTQQTCSYIEVQQNIADAHKTNQASSWVSHHNELCPVLLLSKHLMAKCDSEVSYYHDLINFTKQTAVHLLACSEVL